MSGKVTKLGRDGMNEADDVYGVLFDFSDLSEVTQVWCDQVYSLGEKNIFLDKLLEKSLSRRMRFRLKKILTKTRKVKAVARRKSINFAE